MITVNGRLYEFCDACPHLELIEIARDVLGVKMYGCNNSQLCLHLWKHLKTQNTTRDGDSE